MNSGPAIGRGVDPADLAAAFTYEERAGIVALLPKRAGTTPSDELMKAVQDAYARVLAAQGDALEDARADDLLYGLFKHLADDHRARAFWHRLAEEEKGLDRDGKLLLLWGLVESGGPDGVLGRIGSSPAYHRVWLFDLFLRHYDLRRALRIAGAGRVAASAHWVLFLAVAALFIVRHLAVGALAPAWWVVLLVGACYLTFVLLVALSFRHRLANRLERVVVALHALVPRLGGAAAVGLVILGSSHELVSLVIGVDLPWLLVPLAGGCVYLLAEIARRLHPLPGPGRLLRRAIEIAAVALCHALALTLVGERGLRAIVEPGAAGAFPAASAMSIAVFLFAIGLVVNLIWAEKPVTEPL